MKYVLRHSVKRKCKNIQKINHSEQKLVTLLNLGYLLILVATGNHKLVDLFIIFCCQIADTKIIQSWTLTFGMTHFSGTFCTPEPNPSPNFRKNWTLIYWTLVKNQTLCFFWMQNRPNIGIYTVPTISKIFALALEKK